MIKRNLNKFVGIVIAIFVLIHTVSGQPISPFNKLTFKDSVGKYSFIVSGHFHGASTNLSTYPAATLQANIDTLNSLHPLFLMSLGDVFLDVNDLYIEHYQKSLFDKLNMPLYNAVGNHDLANDNMYEKVFGKSYFSFQNATELYIVLNTEINDGSIKDDQLVFFNETLKNTKEIKNIFIFSHRAVWAENNERYGKLFNGNTRTMIGNNNFEDKVLPLLLVQSQEKKNIFWISGSMGGGPASFFYDKDPKTNIVFMQTAIRDQERDAALLVDVNNGVVSFAGISFTGQKLDDIKNYDINYWLGTKPIDTKFNFRLLPYLIKKVVLHSYFWMGFFSSLFLLFIFRISYRKWKRKK